MVEQAKQQDDQKGRCPGLLDPCDQIIIFPACKADDLPDKPDTEWNKRDSCEPLYFPVMRTFFG